jgi:putative glycerol-1-phosphate prenyltransferase
VGGGLNTRGKIREALLAGADIIVVGNGIEKSHNFLVEAAALVKSYN